MGGRDPELELDSPDALERTLQQNANCREDVGHDRQRGELDCDHEHRCAENQGLDVSAAAFREEVVNEPDPDHGADRRRDCGRDEEDAKRLVHRVDAEDRDGIPAHV